MKNILKAEKPCWVFHFTNFERIVDIVNSGAAEREKSRSKSFAAFRRGSQNQKMKLHKTDSMNEKDEPIRDLENQQDKSQSHSHDNRMKKLETIDENDTT